MGQKQKYELRGRGGFPLLPDAAMRSTNKGLMDLPTVHLEHEMPWFELGLGDEVVRSVNVSGGRENRENDEYHGGLAMTVSLASVSGAGTEEQAHGNVLPTEMCSLEISTP